MPQREAKLPPGPRAPKLHQTIAMWVRPIGIMERNRRRFGKRYTVHIYGTEPIVVLSDPDDIREVFQAPPEVLHPGEGARILEPLVGNNSVILLDRDPHLEQRKLLLPAFRGHNVQALKSLMTEVAEREIDSWPRDQPFPVHPRLAKLTIDIILRTVFGIEDGARLERLRYLLTELLTFSVRPESMIPALRRDFGPISTPFRRFMTLRDEADRIIFDLIDERRAEEERDDVMAMLLAAEHEDGTPMSKQELRDELMTLLAAGHETTASELAWAFERLSREPRVLARLTDEIDRGESEDYLTATVQETLRRRPTLPNAEPRLTKEEVEIGGWLYPEGVSLVCNSYLLHHDPDVYEDPYAFRPERFLEEPPGTYTWIPFGGGRRRCIGASFAMLEMKVVLKAVLERAQVHRGADGPELTRRRAITLSPKRGAPTVLRDRDRVRDPATAPASGRTTKAA